MDICQKVITAEITANLTPSGFSGEIQEATQEAIQSTIRKWAYAAELSSIEQASWKPGQTESNMLVGFGTSDKY